MIILQSCILQGKNFFRTRMHLSSLHKKKNHSLNNEIAKFFSFLFLINLAPRRDTNCRINLKGYKKRKVLKLRCVKKGKDLITFFCCTVILRDKLINCGVLPRFEEGVNGRLAVERDNS